MTYQRMDGETSKAFEAFCVYRDMGPSRSMRKAGDVLHKSMGTLGRWVTRWKWVERAKEYDDAMDKARVSTQVDTLKELTERQIKIGRAFQGVGGAKISEYKRRIDSGDTLNDISLKDAVLATDFGIRTERQALGQVTSEATIPTINVLIIENRDDNDKADRRIQAILREQQG